MARKRRIQENHHNQVREDGQPQKRARKYNDEDVAFVKIYDELSNEIGEKRIRASAELVKRLFLSGPCQAEMVKNALTRLVRGMCSGRKAARVGFSIALTEVFRQVLNEETVITDFHAIDLLHLIHSTTQSEKSSGQERREYLLGELFSFKSLILTLVKVKHNQELQLWRSVLDRLCLIAVEVPWLREECTLIIYDALKELYDNTEASPLVKVLVEVLSERKLFETSQGVAIWLTIQKLYPDCKLPKDIWHHRDPLSSKERSHLATVMREDYSQAEDSKSDKAVKIKSGTYSVKTSFAWDVLLGNLAYTLDSDDEKAFSKFNKFWKETVEENLFSDSASLERKTWGLQIFSRAISLVSRAGLSTICSPKIMKCIINHRTDPKRYLHSASKDPLDAMLARVKAEPGVAVTFVQILTGDLGATNFDEFTHTKTVEGILALTDSQTLLEVVRHLESIMIKPNTSIQSESDLRRKYVADIFLSTLRKRSKGQEISEGIRSRKSWLGRIFAILLKYAYFSPIVERAQSQPEPPVSENTRNVFRSRLLSCLTCLKESKFDEDGFWEHFIVSQVRKLSESDESIKHDYTDDENIINHVQNAYATLDKIPKTPVEDQKNASVFTTIKTLCSFSLIELFNGEPNVISILEDLESLSSTNLDSLDTDPQVMDVLIDIILSIISRSSTLSRKVGESCFKNLTQHMTESNIKSLLEVLLKPENTIGQDDLFAHEVSDDEIANDMSEADTSSSENSDSLSSVSSSAVNNEAEDITGDTSDYSEENQSTVSDVASEQDEELSKFNSLLADVLKVQKDDDGNDKAGQPDESEESDMDDEQMMALEPHLANVFKERKKAVSRKKVDKDAKEAMLAFKNRVLELLLIYTKQEHANPLAITLILPLMQVMRRTQSKQIAEKTFNYLKQYFDTCKSKGLPSGAPDKTLWKNLEKVHVEVSKSTTKMLASACSRSSLFLAKVLIAKNAKNYNGITDLYAATQKSWYSDPKSKIQPALFTEWISWSIGTRVHM